MIKEQLEEDQKHQAEKLMKIARDKSFKVKQ